MPNTNGSAKKNASVETSATNSPQRLKNKSGSTENSGTGGKNSASTTKQSNRARKRKRREIVRSSESELESELEECNFEDAIALERKLRKVAKTNSLNDDEMKKLLQKFVKNEHVLAFVTLKAEDELAKERIEYEKRTIVITDIPSVPKLTRAKARELNKTPGITLPALHEPPQPEIAALIKEDLNSDEDDEEYVFKDEDFVSDDDPNATNSDFDSNPCTPCTPLTQTEYDESPVKLTSDGCFKIPMDKCDQIQENMRIAARTRSKLCLQQTTIEDIQSEFVPPDLDLNETHDADVTANDEDWMQFLNDFSKPLNNSVLGDDDDPVNDPEYIAADKEQVDAEELRDVNISKKELTELVAELFEGLVNDGVSLESIDLETPQKFLENSLQFEMEKLATPTTLAAIPRYVEVSRQINFDEVQTTNSTTATTTTTTTITTSQGVQQTCVSDSTISSTNVTQPDCTFQSDIMSTPGFESRTNTNNLTLIPVGVTASVENNKTISIPNATNAPELIAIPVPGQPNHFHLARVLATQDPSGSGDIIIQSPERIIEDNTQIQDKRYSVPYDNNFTWQYISVRRHVYTEYMEKFESLRNVQNVSNDILKNTNQKTGFTTYQHDLLQQQLRIHTQMLTQTYIQIYSHPEFWKMAPQVRSMLDELNEKSVSDVTFNAWNLKPAIELINRWEQELAADTPENKDMMAFLHKEIELTNRNTRQIPRFAPRIMDFILQSNVFMYPSHLPRIPFSPKITSYETFAPSESLLIAIGLDKHMRGLQQSGRNISKKKEPLIIACKYMSKDTVFGKNKRRLWDQVKKLRNAPYYNPVKYYFEHNCAPPIEHELITFENNTVLPPIQRLNELPLAWQHYIQKKNEPAAAEKSVKPATTTKKTQNETSKTTSTSYLDIVREAVGENIQLPDCLIEPTSDSPSSSRSKKKKSTKRSTKPNNVTINVNYVFGAGSPNGDITSLINTTAACTPRRIPAQLQIDQISSNIVAYNYDLNLQQLEPIQLVNTVENDDTEVEVPQNAPPPTASAQQQPAVVKVGATSRRFRKIFSHSFNHTKRFGVSRKHHRVATLHRRRGFLKKRFLQLFTAHRQQLHEQEDSYKHSAVILDFYKRFRALELYTELLDELKMFCRNNAQSPSSSTCSSNKRARSEDDACNSTAARIRKVTRQEENLRNMLLPDSGDDSNRKDAIYAFNFYEKVEEVFKSANRSDDYEKFNGILKSFNPKTDSAADLYYKLEALFSPDYPELAQVFLTFLLPSEAAEIGKFFEHFMITNMTTFINKLNIYFNKQPAQIRKIYNCLSELAEDTDVSMKKVEEKILPLLKGNQFLIDWFMQQFPEAAVPERILPVPEHVNLKEVQNNQNGEFMETMKDILDSPPSDQQPHCQLRYINGRIFYGSKMTLPAKLSFMAKTYSSKDESIPSGDNLNFNGCLHGIKEYGEQLLAAAVATTAQPNTLTNSISTLNDAISDDMNDKSEEDELSKALVIDTTVTTGGEEDSCSSIEACDDATLRSHALRLNPSYYGNACFPSVTATSTPNTANVISIHHPNAKKQSLNFNEDMKIMSPRKNVFIPAFTTSPQPESTCSSNLASMREKRKSPIKKIRSPNATTKSRGLMQQQQQQILQQPQPMVVIHNEHNTGPIVYAKKLKSMIENDDEQQTSSQPEIQSENIHIPIIARVKQRLPPHPVALIDQSSHISKAESDENGHFLGKYENSDEMEFLPEHTPPRKTIEHPKLGFPKLEVHADSSAEECAISGDSIHRITDQQTAYNVAISSTNVDSDEDCKLDIVATLATTANEHQSDSKTAGETITMKVPKPIATLAFTRDEDKIILIEMKLGSNDRNDLLERIRAKLPNRTLNEISTRHQFLMDFLSKLQGKQST